MNTKIKLKNKHTIKQLEVAIKTSKDEEQKTRLRAIIQLKNGDARTKVSKVFVIRNKTLISWIKRYNEKGIKGLIFSKGGRPKGNLVWDQEIFDDLTEEIKKSNKCWSILLMQEWIKKHKNKEVPTTTVWNHLKDLNFSYKSLRPHPYKGNRKAQEAFKKGGSKML